MNPATSRRLICVCILCWLFAQNSSTAESASTETVPPLWWDAHVEFLTGDGGCWVQQRSYTWERCTSND